MNPLFDLPDSPTPQQHVQRPDLVKISSLPSQSAPPMTNSMPSQAAGTVPVGGSQLELLLHAKNCQDKEVLVSHSS